MSTRLILDVATCPLDGAAQWLPEVKAARNLKDPAKIEADLADKRTAQQDGMGLDLDLCRISAIGWCDVTLWEHGPIQIQTAETEADEGDLLRTMRRVLKSADTVTFNGLAFDLPLIERRLMYNRLMPLGWNLDRYRSTHVDLLAKLSNFGQRPYRSLAFYVKRLGWTDLSKPLQGAEEAAAVAAGDWDAIRASVMHDVEATRRLAVWMGILSESV